LSAIMTQHDFAFAALIAIACFVFGGLIMFPVVILIAATAAALDPGPAR
jgi:phospholipase D1/2